MPRIDDRDKKNSFHILVRQCLTIVFSHLLFFFVAAQYHTNLPLFLVCDRCTRNGTLDTWPTTGNFSCGCLYAFLPYYDYSQTSHGDEDDGDKSDYVLPDIEPLTVPEQARQGRVRDAFHPRRVPSLPVRRCGVYRTTTTSSTCTRRMCQDSSPNITTIALQLTVKPIRNCCRKILQDIKDNVRTVVGEANYVKLLLRPSVDDDVAVFVRVES